MNQYPYIFPTTPFSFSILVDSPIRCNLPFSPVSALIFPVAKTDLVFSSLIIIGLDILMTFLFKRSYVRPPYPRSPVPGNPNQTLSLTLPQLAELIRATSEGRIPLPSGVGYPGQGYPGRSYPHTAPGQGLGPVGHDEPLFPDNLSISLLVAAPFAPFDGSPDTSFNVPLFEIPGAPGNLIIALGLFIAQFFIERAGAGNGDCQINQHP